jgi:2'-5' RNA ligase
MRAFVAIDLPDQVRDTVASWQDGLRVGRRVPWENLHLTLAFLDDQSEFDLRALHERLAEIEVPAFDLELSGLELFGGKWPRVLYVKADGGRALMALHKAVRRAAEEVGIDMPRERFRPHVTLARFRRDMMEEEAVKLGRFMASHGDVQVPVFGLSVFCLFGSTLHPEGAVHEVLARYDLT